MTAQICHSLLQNTVSFIGLFCKRDLFFGTVVLPQSHYSTKEHVTGFSRCNTLQHTIVTNTLQHAATHCNTLQHTATNRNTLQHTITHCIIPQRSMVPESHLLRCVAVWCSLLQCVAVCCSVLHTRVSSVAVCCGALRCVAGVLRCVAVCCTTNASSLLYNIGL
jgi:hypothetical protein